MKATKNIPEPVVVPPPTYTVELTEVEAKALYVLAGTLGTSEISRLVTSNSVAAARATGLGLSTDPMPSGDIRTATDGLYYALERAGIKR